MAISSCWLNLSLGSASERSCHIDRVARNDDRHHPISRSYFMNKFRKLGLISYNGRIEAHNSLLSAVLHEKPGTSGGLIHGCGMRGGLHIRQGSQK